MYYYDTEFDECNKLKELLSEVWPGIQVKMVSCDYNLERPGFVKSAPCKTKLDISSEDTEKLLDKLMEYEAIGCDAPKTSKAYQSYRRYNWMWDVLRYMECEEGDANV